MPSPALGIILRQSYDARRRAFVDRITQIVGAIPIAGYLPHRNDIAVSTDPWSGRVWTPEAGMAGQVLPLGRGSSRTFVAASTNYLTTPDTANLSFGNGTVDSAFSIVSLALVTDTALDRIFMSKWVDSTREWLFWITTADKLQLFLADESVNAFPQRLSDAVITQGSYHLFGVTYDATGGATAADGITLYQDGAVIASTATNAGTYVAMEDVVDAVPILGARNITGFTNFWDGNMALLLVVSGVLTEAQMLLIKAAANSHFGLAL